MRQLLIAWASILEIKRKKTLWRAARSDFLEAIIQLWRKHIINLLKPKKGRDPLVHTDETYGCWHAQRVMYQQYKKDDGATPPDIAEPELNRCPLTQEGMAFRPCQELLRSLLRSPRLAPLLWPLHLKMHVPISLIAFLFIFIFIRFNYKYNLKK
jgi:hypothetical protein